MTHDRQLKDTSFREKEEDPITIYRGTTALLNRVYRDQEIRHFVLAISAAIKRAVAQGDDNVALNLATALLMAEPLEERTTQDCAGLLITIAYLYYVLRDQAEALHITQDATRHFPDDALFRRILQLLST